MAKVRIGVVGLGNMGMSHAAKIADGLVAGAELAAVCDKNANRLKLAEDKWGAIAKYTDVDEMYRSGKIDGVIIATPHYDHPELSIKAFHAGLHVLVEKPAGVYTKQVRKMNEEAERSGLVFGIMFNQRTNPLYQKLRELVQSGELGEIKRTVWIIDWYRSQSYYDSAGWRATWAGEGGGVLINQDPHQLDLWQWTLGMMPVKLRAFCHIGKYHDIEVEDDVTAYVEFPNGATGLFVTSTGQAPGTNRLEVSADRGKVVIEDGKLVFWRNRIPERQFNREYKGGFGQPECWKCEIPITGKETGHVGIMNNWVDAILNGAELLAPGVEGIHSLTLSNAMYLSAWTDDWVHLPLDEDLFYQLLREKIARSSYRKQEGEDRILDVSGSH